MFEDQRELVWLHISEVLNLKKFNLKLREKKRKTFYKTHNMHPCVLRGTDFFLFFFLISLCGVETLFEGNVRK